MSVPYVELQKAIIAWLKFRVLYYDLVKRSVRILLRDCRTSDARLTPGWRQWLASNGLNLPESLIVCLDVDLEVPKILLEQVDDSGDKLVVRDILGWPLRHNLGEAYGLEGLVENRGHGHNCLRTERFSQPQMLRVGDVLATGETVCFEPRGGGNGSVLVKLKDGPDPEHTIWMEYPSRTALALLTPEDKAPAGLVYP